MGIDIGILTALNYSKVFLWHRKDKSIALERLNHRLDNYVEKDILNSSERETVLNNIQTCDSLKEVCKSDLIIESISENFNIKYDLFDFITRFSSNNSIVVSNTSSLSIDSLSNAFTVSDRFAGLHFFNPVLRIELIEVIKGAKTSIETIDTLKYFCSTIGKTPIHVKDSPGFIVNRLMAAQINQAIKLLEQGVATEEDIDGAIKLGLLHPIGPLALADLIGLDVFKDILESLYERTNDMTFKSPDCLKRKIESGFLGRKAGRGFYTYGK